MKVIEIAQEIYTSLLNSPSDTGPANIAFWLRENIGQLNNLLGLSLTINSSAQFSSDLTEAQKAVYKQLYLLNYYDFQIRSNLGASAISSVLQVDDFGTSVKLSNKNEIAKTWLQLRRNAKDLLDTLIRDYGLNKVTPLAVHGDDCFYSLNGGLSDSLIERS